MLRRVPLKRKTPLRARRSDYEWRKARKAALERDHGRCRSCWRPGNEVHHVLSRARGGKHDLDNLRTLCSSCHRYVHEHPEWATQHGFMESAGGSHIPVE